jgi:hypothetical protein
MHVQVCSLGRGDLNVVRQFAAACRLRVLPDGHEAAWALHEDTLTRRLPSGPRHGTCIGTVTRVPEEGGGNRATARTPASRGVTLLA